MLSLARLAIQMRWDRELSRVETGTLGAGGGCGPVGRQRVWWVLVPSKNVNDPYNLEHAYRSETES